jgi:hypothetical protein
LSDAVFALHFARVFVQLSASIVSFKATYGRPGCITRLQLEKQLCRFQAHTEAVSALSPIGLLPIIRSRVTAYLTWFGPVGDKGAVGGIQIVA